MSERLRRGGRAAGHGLPGSSTPDEPERDPVAPRSTAVEAEPVAKESVETLARFIVTETGMPIDVWAIAALLESTGIRDRDAVERYGRRDVFALAQAVHLRLPDDAEFPTGLPPVPEPLSRSMRARRNARFLGRGMFFFIPLTLQLISLIAVGVSQFAAVDFTTAQASVVAVAATLSFIVTAAFIQGLGYLAPIFIESGKHMLAETVSWTVVGVGALAALGFGIVAYGLVAATDALPGEQLRISAAYYALVAAQGLAGALLYIVRAFTTIIVATVVSLVVAGILYKQSSLAIEKIHWLSLTSAIVIQLAAAAVLLRRRAGHTEGDMRLARLPRTRLLFRRAYPFAVYGIVYFSFLTVDRVVAWADGSHPLPLWFQAPYELGLDWALAAIVLSLAFLEVTVENFSALLVPTAERLAVNATREFNRALARFWGRQLAVVGLLAACGTWAALALAVGLHELDALGPAESLYQDPITRYVFGLGVLGYALLAVGIANSVFLMSLNRPWRAIVAIAPGVLVSLVVGIVLTTYEDYWTAIFGMLAGALVFAAVSGWQTWRTLRHADYFNYSAW